MDVAALIIAIVTFLVFAHLALKTRPIDLLPTGLALLTAAWICQLVSIAGDKVHS